MCLDRAGGGGGAGGAEDCGGFSSRTITGPLKNFQITINPIEILGMQDAVTQIQRTDDGMFVASIFIFIIIVLVAEASLVLVGFFGGILSDLIIWATGGITLDVQRRLTCLTRPSGASHDRSCRPRTPMTLSD